MAALSSPKRSTTHASGESAVSFGGPTARACPAAATPDDYVASAGLELHTEEPWLTSAAHRMNARPSQLLKIMVTICPASGQVPLRGQKVKVRRVAKEHRRTRQDQARKREGRMRKAAGQRTKRYHRRCQGWQKQKEAMTAEEQGRHHQRWRRKNHNLRQEALPQRS